MKIKTPWQAPVRLDCEPGALPGAHGPAVPLWITEAAGSRRGGHGRAALLALLSVDAGSATACAARLEDVRGTTGTCNLHATSTRDKVTVAGALTRFTGWLEYRDARVRHVILPPGDGGRKTGLDDYLAAGHSTDEAYALARAPGSVSGVSSVSSLVSANTLDTPDTADTATEAEDGAKLLDEVQEFLSGYVIFPSTAAAVTATLWAAHTHLVSEFESTPRLALLSPEKQCGKSRVLELLELLSAGAETLSDASPAYLFRRIGAGPVTILLDEADAIWKRGKADETAEALRSIVNAGHRRSATVGRVEMNGQGANLTRFPVYAPAAIAGIGNLPDTIMDRAVIVRMRRRAPVSGSATTGNGPPAPKVTRCAAGSPAGPPLSRPGR